MLEEAIEVIRLLWQGGTQDYRSIYYTVENARIYTLPAQPPPIMVAASGPKAAELAGRMGDGLVTTSPDARLARTFAEAGGGARPRIVELSVCWAESEAAARRTALEVWPIAGFEGPLVVELPLPRHFEAVARMVTEERVARAVVCGPDPARHLAAIRQCAEGGYDHVCVHQIGPEQEGFLRFYRREVLPHVGGVRARRRAA
jgi:G6PDH family F420-dependent oxidoreductase